jgi:hypothetical protein
MEQFNSEDQNTHKVETGYEKHQQNPGPSKEAVVEDDKDGASKVLKWILPALVIVLILVWLFVKE